MVCSTFSKCSPSKILDCHVTVPKSIFARASLVIAEWFLSQKCQTDSVMCQLWICKSGCLEPWVEAWRPGCVWVQLEVILWLVINVFLGFHTAGVMASPISSVWNGVSLAAYLYLWVRQGLRKEQSSAFHPDSGSSLLQSGSCRTGQVAGEMFRRPWNWRVSFWI